MAIISYIGAGNDNAIKRIKNCELFSPVSIRNQLILSI